ncbi:MAG: hypothetical protein GC171_07075 [Terrimonas sp.]|nr:hypothetical protein [Terrimonas sp.]
MKRNLLLALFLFISFITFSQEDLPTMTKKFVPSLASIQTLEGKRVNGWFYSVTDDQVSLLKPKKRLLHYNQQTKIDHSGAMILIPTEQINIIGLKRKNNVMKGALIGFGVGALSGIIGGIISGDDPVTRNTGEPFSDLFNGIRKLLTWKLTAGQKAVAGGLVFGLTGAATGAIIGALVKKKFFIGGKKEAFRQHHSELIKRAMLQ